MSLACALAALLLATAPAGASLEVEPIEPASGGEAELSRCAGAGGEPATWERSAFDPLDYFSEEELADWSAFRGRQRAIALAGLALSLLLYAAFALTRAGKATFSAAEIAASFAASLPLLRSAAAGRVSAVLGRVFGPDWAASLLFTWLFLLLVAAALLPLQLLAEQDARASGLSVYTTSAWLWDLAKGLFLRAASLTLVVFGLFGLIRRMPRYWWLALGGPAALAMVAWGVASPYQARAFYDFTPLEDEALRGRLERLAEERGIELTRVNVIDASRHTTGINAYVTGLGPTRELVVFDTTLELLEDDELEAAFAHELGHIERERPVTRYVLSALTLLLLMWGLSVLLRVVPARIGLAGPGDPRALPLLLLAVSLCFLLARPVERAWSRHEERLADRSGLMLTCDAGAFVRLQVALARHNRADVSPPPWAVFWFATHPPVEERIATALWFERWLEGREAPVSD